MVGDRVWELRPIISKPRPLLKDIGPWSCFFDQSGSFMVEICLFNPLKPYSISGVDRVNLSKVLFILPVFHIMQISKKSVTAAFVVLEAFL